ncbi:MAG: class I SAM-dependent methyltransferase [Actinomycetota bacterium]
MSSRLLDDAFLAGQQAYYAARAGEYNEWWDRRGRYDHGAAANARWFREQAQLFDALNSPPLSGDVLELACGTGNFTLPLARTARRLTAIDGSVEMLAINRSRVASASVEYVQADLFGWEPERAYDAVVFTFWLSHVPPDRLDAFLAQVRRALRPGGALFFADSRRDPLTSTPDQPLPEREQPWLKRRLKDGREYEIVKVFYEPEALGQRFLDHDLSVKVCETESFFLFGRGVRLESAADG